MIRRSLIFTGPRRVAVQEEELSLPGPGQVLVQTLVSGISAGTELLVYRGQAPADLAVCPNGGSLEFPRPSTAGICPETDATLCAADCGGNGPCVNYAYETEFPVPLDGLAASEATRGFSVRESIDGKDRNGDGDTNDTAIIFSERATGKSQPLGVTAGCSLNGTPDGRGVVRIFDPSNRSFDLKWLGFEDETLHSMIRLLARPSVARRWRDPDPVDRAPPHLPEAGRVGELKADS